MLDWCRPGRRSRTSRGACQWIAPPPSWRGLRLAMTYAVKEIFKTLQGEGAQAGRAAVFCRFSGCNLWSGREADRASAICQFCDTDFVGIEGVGGGRFSSADALAEAIEVAWAGAAEQRFVVFTGGEPLLQVNAELIAAMHDRNFECAVESNGTQPAPADLDWICVSPKAGAPKTGRASCRRRVCKYVEISVG